MSTRSWNILCWNIRGINGHKKWDAIRDKINESGCSIVCLQETKRGHFDTPIISQLISKRLDKYEFVPFIGASGGILVAWNGSLFTGNLIDSKTFGITLKFISTQNLQKWKLTTVYGPCQQPLRSQFSIWLRNHIIQDDENWLFLGDFNFYRS